MAYKKQTWTNDRNRQQLQLPTDILGSKARSTREATGDPSLAVDGLEETSDWSKCATMDNYFVDKPVWMVDLGRMKNVAGVMLRTWPGTDPGSSLRGLCRSQLIAVCI